MVHFNFKYNVIPMRLQLVLTPYERQALHKCAAYKPHEGKPRQGSSFNFTNTIRIVEIFGRRTAHKAATWYFVHLLQWIWYIVAIIESIIISDVILNHIILSNLFSTVLSKNVINFIFCFYITWYHAKHETSFLG